MRHVHADGTWRLLGIRLGFQTRLSRACRASLQSGGGAFPRESAGSGDAGEFRRLTEWNSIRRYNPAPSKPARLLSRPQISWPSDNEQPRIHSHQLCLEACGWLLLPQSSSSRTDMLISRPGHGPAAISNARLCRPSAEIAGWRVFPFVTECPYVPLGGCSWPQTRSSARYPGGHPPFSPRGIPPRLRGAGRASLFPPAEYVKQLIVQSVRPCHAVIQRASRKLQYCASCCAGPCPTRRRNA
jgi:hypothetical protein